MNFYTCFGYSCSLSDSFLGRGLKFTEHLSKYFSRDAIDLGGIELQRSYRVTLC